MDNDDTSSYYKIHHNFFYLGGGVKCDYDGHEKRFYNNVMLGTTAGCWHTCAYKKGFPDYCHDNKLVQAKPRFNPSMNKTVVSPFAIIWFCDATNVSHVLPDYSNEVQMVTSNGASVIELDLRAPSNECCFGLAGPVHPRQRDL